MLEFCENFEKVSEYFGSEHDNRHTISNGRLSTKKGTTSHSQNEEQFWKAQRPQLVNDKARLRPNVNVSTNEFHSGGIPLKFSETGEFKEFSKERNSVEPLINPFRRINNKKNAGNNQSVLQESDDTESENSASSELGSKSRLTESDERLIFDDRIKSDAFKETNDFFKPFSANFPNIHPPSIAHPSGLPPRFKNTAFPDICSKFTL